MENLTLSEKVKEIVANCNNTVTINNKSYNQRDIVERTNCYINNQFKDRDDGIFWNISNHRITHFAKNIDLDTKDFYPYAIGEANFFQGWALRKFVKKWFDDEQFYQTLNDLSEGLATYGSIVWKKYKEDGKTKLSECNFLHLYYDQTAKSINKTDVVELHEIDEYDILNKEGVWDNLDKLKEELKKKKGKIEVWEFTGYYNEEKKHCYGYDYGEGEIVLWEETLKEDEDIYYDFHLGRYSGRHLRVGVVERLFKLQEQANKLVNQNDASNEIASLLLLKTSNGDYTGNVLEQAINGEIIGDPELNQLILQNPGIASFAVQMQTIENQADKLCLTPEFITGEATPSGVPFRSLATLSNAAKSAFKNYRDSIGEKVGRILLKEVFPSVVKGWNGKKSFIEIKEDEQDVEIYDQCVENIMVKDAILNGQIVDDQYLMSIKQMIRDGIKTVGRKIETPEQFFDFKWGFKMTPTGESVDKTQQNDAYFNALTLSSSNPALVNLPLFRQYLENNGISYWKLTPEQQGQLVQAGQMANQPGQVTPELKKPDALLATVNS